MSRGLSLANKCQLLFGAAVIFIIFAALLAPWLRIGAIIDQSELDATREIARLWATTATDEAPEVAPGEYVGPLPPGAPEPRVRVRRLTGDDLNPEATETDFAGAAVDRLLENPDEAEVAEAIWDGDDRVYRLALARRNANEALQSVILVERRSPRAAAALFVNRLYLLSAGLVAGGLAVLVFYLITTRLILGPVRRLRDTAQRVQQGEHGVRADLRTGDEFEQLGEAFNDMLVSLQEQRERLETANRTLDSKVTRLEEANLALNEAARLKGDFLASVSHELRTPLNSIIGFAELLQQIAERDLAEELVSDREHWAKRQRYLDNIVAAGRSLLDMINDLLNMAKLEAGRMDLHVEPISVREACESLIALIRPQAERKGISLELETPRLNEASPGNGQAPNAAAAIIETDPRKFQQVVFNFLSNAVKFTPEGGRVVLRAERLVGRDDEPRLRVSVLDDGPGIPPEDHERIFEKFTQLESGHTRLHAGTGLGLAICKELAAMLQGEIQLISEPGRGSMFSVIVPVRMDPDRSAEMTLRLAGRTPGPPQEHSSASRTPRSDGAASPSASQGRDPQDE